MEESKFQRIRRTRTEMKTDVLNAVSQLSKEKQLSLITMVDVSKCSGIRVDVLQRLLVWELAEDNPTTRRLATSREQFYAEVFAGYKHLFEGTGLHIDIISALINAGIYYLVLHRKRSTFWGVDFYKRSERKRLLEATDQLLTLIKLKPIGEPRKISCG